MFNTATARCWYKKPAHFVLPHLTTTTKTTTQNQLSTSPPKQIKNNQPCLPETNPARLTPTSTLPSAPSSRTSALQLVTSKCRPKVSPPEQRETLRYVCHHSPCDFTLHIIVNKLTIPPSPSTLPHKPKATQKATSTLSAETSRRTLALLLGTRLCALVGLRPRQRGRRRS